MKAIHKAIKTAATPVRMIADKLHNSIPSKEHKAVEITVGAGIIMLGTLLSHMEVHSFLFKVAWDTFAELIKGLGVAPLVDRSLDFMEDDVDD